MATVDLTTENFNETIESNDIVLIDFWAAWCGPCQTFGPIYEKVAEQHPDLVFGKVDTEDQQALGAAFDIRSIPTLMVIRDGVMVFNQAGVLPEDALGQLVERVQELDMDEVRAELDEHDEARAAS